MADCFIYQSISGKEGRRNGTPEQHSLQLSNFTKRATSFQEALNVLDHLVLMCARVENMGELVRCPAHLKVCMIQHVFTHAVPVPLGDAFKSVIRCHPPPHCCPCPFSTAAP